MKRFEDKTWKDFLLTDFFLCEKGNQNNMASLNAGEIPLVSAKKCDNGYKGFVARNKKNLFQENIITLNNDGDGGAGIAYYQPYKMALDSHVTALIPKIPMNKYILLFIAMCITKQRNRFGHGYSLNAYRLRAFKMMLPLNESHSAPDWHFMESYMRQQEQQILKPTLEKLCKHLIENEIIGGGNYTDCTWKEFVFGKEFLIEATHSGIDKNKLNAKEGTIPYITRSDKDNGIDSCVSTQENKYSIDNGNVITIGLDTQTVFYQPSAFYTGQNIQIISHPQLNKYNAMFLIVAIKKLVEKFSWGSYGATLTRLKKGKLYLPATEDGHIDFTFMSDFMRTIEEDILSNTLSYFKNRLDAKRIETGGGKMENI